MAKRARSTSLRRPAATTPRPDVREIIREELSKALALPPGASSRQITTGYLQALQRGVNPGVSGTAALTRDPYNNTSFGPGEPLFPAPLDPLLPSGRPAPRRWEYPVSWNLQTSTTRAVPWSVLRDAADQVSIMRACIEVRKATVTGLEWSFGIDSVRARHLAKRQGTSDHTVASDLQDKYADDIDRLHQWWSKPDRINNWTFSEWLGALLEDQLVLDAVALYPHLSLGGGLHSLELLDGSCYSDDTEVLTKRGWLKFHETDLKTDWFATRSPKTKAFEWQQATYYHRAPFKGDMYHFGVRQVDLLVTPNHRMLVTALPEPLGGKSRGRRCDHSEVILTAEELAKYGNGQASRIPMTSVWEAPDLEYFHLPANGHWHSKSFTCSGDDFAAFMGMYLSEGSISSGNPFRVQIAQRRSSSGFAPYKKVLDRIFDDAAFHSKDGSFEVTRRCLRDYLAQFGKAQEKYVPDVVKNMSARQLGIFWDYYMLGDGTTERRIREGGRQAERQRIITTSKRMADDLQEIAQKIGHHATISCFTVIKDSSIRDRDGSVRTIKAINMHPRYTVNLCTTEERRWSVSTVPYDGEVFCVSVPNEVLYVRRNGKPAWCGNTIKPLLDRRGATPQPPYAAFQQILWGFPRSETAQSPSSEVSAEFVSAIYGPPEGRNTPTDALIYKVRNRRSKSPYGFSCAEQALADIDLWLKRYDWLRSEYTAGVTPEMIVQVDANMTPEQLRQYEAVFNDDLSGRTAERHRARFLPAGFDPSYPGSIDAKFHSDLDLHLIRLICAAFDVMPTSLGFTPNHGMGGMGGQGMHGAEQDTQLYRATKPTAQWLTDLINEVSTYYLGMPPEVTFQFHDLDNEDDQKEAELLTGYVQGGLQTLNEGRDQLNLPRYEFPEADQPMVVTPTGPVWLNVDVQPTSPPGNLPSVAANQQPPDQTPPPAPGESVARAPDNVDVDAGPKKRVEQKAFLAVAKAYASARDRPWREFIFKTESPDTAAAANRLAAAGDLDAVKALFELDR